MGIDNYIPVAQRLAEAQTTLKGLIVEPEVSINWEKETALVKVVMRLDGKAIATAHAIAGDLSDDKALEKAETIAVGRALAFMGYPAESADSQEESSPKPNKKKSGGLGSGLGAKKASKAKDADEDEESEEDDEEETEEEEAPVKKGFGPKKSSPKKEETEDDDDEDEEESEDSDDESEEEKAPAKKGNPKLTGVMAKYGLK
jgi:hypothetical protein